MLNLDAHRSTRKISQRLGHKQVCLTFDDGQRIEQPGGRKAVSELRRMGHLIGNHTFTHPNLADLIKEDKERVVGELVDAHRIIRDFVGEAPLLFRPPFLGWNQAVWKTLKPINEMKKYHGPIGCDVMCCDWDIGRQRDGGVWTRAHFQGHLLGQLRLLEKGVVLLHDSSADKILNEANYRREQEVFELTKWLVGWLKRENYGFVGLDELVVP
jgi:peptidoglycan/xylan/chitin deacetylase (PgdA/CDA1 family)